MSVNYIYCHPALQGLYLNNSTALAMIITVSNISNISNLAFSDDGTRNNPTPVQYHV